MLPEKNPIADAAIGELVAAWSRHVRHRARQGADGGFISSKPEPASERRRWFTIRDGSSIAIAKPGVIEWKAVLEGAEHLPHHGDYSGPERIGGGTGGGKHLRAARAQRMRSSCAILNYRENLWKWGKTGGVW